MIKPRLARRFAADVRGAVALLFGLAVVPIVGIAGIAVDFTRVTADRADLQSAADAAALATAMSDAPGSELDALAADIARAKLTHVPGLAVVDVAHDERGGVHVVDIVADRPGVFGSVLGVGGSRLAVTAEAGRETVGRPAEIAIVFDTTNSMSFGDRWTSAVDTITDMLTRLEAQSAGSFHVSLVPFGDRVNIDGIVDAENWVDGLPPGSSWNGCVEPRTTPSADYPHALGEEAPEGEDARRFVATHRDNMPSRHVGQAYSRNGLPVCPRSSIVPPTSDLTTIATALENLRPAGTGRFDEGLAWGWRMVSPTWSGLFGVQNYPSAAGLRDKIVFFFTDGQSTAYDWEVEGATEDSYGRNKGSVTAFQHLVDLCARMKASGVRLVMMQLEGNDDFTKYARSCASSPDDYYFVEGLTSLESALATVGLGDGGVRLVR